MKRLAIMLILLIIAACAKEHSETAVPTQAQVADGTDVVKVDPKAVEFTSTDRRRFNGNNGNGNGGQNNDTTSTWVVNTHIGNWNVTWDTSTCGFLIMRWDDIKPATTNMLDSVYISNYGLQVEPNPATCAGVAVCLTNLFWTKYGSTCAVTPSSTLQIRIGWAKYDNTRKVCDKYFSEWVTVYTGQRYEICNN